MSGYSGSNAPASAVNPMIESPYIPSSESTVSGRSSSPEHPGERVADSSMQPHSSLAMQYVNHANMSTTGYAYAEHGRLHGVTDVDVDEKPHLVYETMTDLQATRQRMMMNGGPPQTHASTNFAGIPNKRAGYTRLGATCRVMLVIWNFLLLLLIAGAFGLSSYNFFILSDKTVPEPPSNTLPVLEEEPEVSLAELNNTVTKLREELVSQFESRYWQLNDTIFRVFESIGTVSPSNELDLTAGCSTTSSTCDINHNNFQGRTLPASQSCETDPVTLEVEGSRNVNIYCSIDNSGGEVNPITSTLNIYSGEASCLCNLVAFTAPTASPVCRLTIQRCPDTIRLNTTNMR